MHSTAGQRERVYTALLTQCHVAFDYSCAKREMIFARKSRLTKEGMDVIPLLLEDSLAVVNHTDHMQSSNGSGTTGLCSTFTAGMMVSGEESGECSAATAGGVDDTQSQPTKAPIVYASTARSIHTACQPHHYLVFALALPEVQQ